MAQLRYHWMECNPHHPSKLIIARPCRSYLKFSPQPCQVCAQCSSILSTIFLVLRSLCRSVQKHVDSTFTHRSSDIESSSRYFRQCFRLHLKSKGDRRLSDFAKKIRSSRIVILVSLKTKAKVSICSLHRVRVCRFADCINRGQF